MLTRRKTLFVGIFLSCLFFAFYLWLGTGPVRRCVVDEISHLCGTAVEIDRVSIRWGQGLVVKGLRIRESTNPDSPVICSAPRVDLDGSLTGLVRGRFRVTAVLVHKPELHIRHGANRDWLLDLPLHSLSERCEQQFVPIRIRDGQLRFSAIGGDPAVPLRIGGIQLSLTRDQGSSRIRIESDVQDSVWSSWKISGSFDPRLHELRGHIRTPSLELKHQHSEWLTARLQSVWKSLQPSGRVAVEAEFTYHAGSGAPLEYQLLIDPEDLAMQLPTVPGRIRGITGRMEITPRDLRIHGLVGQMASGEISARGTFSYELSPFFSVAVNLRRIPLREMAGEVLRDASLLGASLTGRLELDGMPDPQTWSGSFDGAVARAEGADSLPLQCTIQDGEVVLDTVRFGWAGGTFALSANVPLDSAAIATGSLSFDSADLNRVCGLVGEHPIPVAGTADGRLSFSVPIATWADKQSWSLRGPVRLKGSRFGDVLFDSLEGALAYRSRRLVLEQGSAVMAGHYFNGSVELTIEPPFTLAVRFLLRPVDLGARTRFGPDTGHDGILRGQLEATGLLNGTLEPLNLGLTGVATLRRPALANHEFGNATATYSLSGTGIDFQGKDLKVSERSIRWQGRWDWSDDTEPAEPTGQSRSRDGSGSVAVVADYDGIDLAELLPLFSDGSLPLDGHVSGIVEIGCLLDDAGSTADLEVTAAIESEDLRVSSCNFTNSRATVRLRNGSVTVPEWSAAFAGGRLSGTARIDGSDVSPMLEAQVAATNLSLGHIVRSISTREGVASVRGTASAQLAVQWDMNAGEFRGQGWGRIGSFALDGLPRIDSLTTRHLEIHNRRVVLNGFHATLWGGVATGSATIDFADDAARMLDVVLDRMERVELARLAAASPLAAAKPAGTLSGAGKLYIPGGTRGATVFGSGEFDVESGSLFGLPVSRAQGSVDAWDGATHDWNVSRVEPRRSPATLQHSDPRILIRVRDARAARGHVHGAVLLAFHRPLSYDVNLQGSGLDLTTVAKSVFASQYRVSGDLSGSMRLRGTERGAADAHGEFTRLRVDNGNLWHLPVVAVIVKESSRVLNRMLNRESPEASQTAEARRVTLSGGRIHFDEFRLYGEAGKLIGTGSVSLDRQLDLEVVGNFDTGLTRNVPILGALQKAANLAQQRLVKFRITGSLDDPVAIPVPLQDVTEPAERFLRGIIKGSFFENPAEPPPMRR